MNATLVVSIVGIFVAGIVGPTLSSWAGRRADEQRFQRDQASRRRDDLRSVVDDAARLLALGGTNVRVIRDARARNVAEPDDVREWASSVHVLEQRLLLRVPATDVVATTYRDVRQSLIALDVDESKDSDRAVANFEALRDAFLTAARRALEAQVA
jgi:hypothetical protein